MPTSSHPKQYKTPQKNRSSTRHQNDHPNLPQPTAPKRKPKAKRRNTAAPAPTCWETRAVGRYGFSGFRHPGPLPGEGNGAWSGPLSQNTLYSIGQTRSLIVIVGWEALWMCSWKNYATVVILQPWALACHKPFKSTQTTMKKQHNLTKNLWKTHKYNNMFLKGKH